MFSSIPEGRQIAQGIVRSVFVVLPSPLFDLESSFLERLEPVDIQTLPPEAGIEALDKGVLDRPTRSDVLGTTCITSGMPSSRYERTPRAPARARVKGEEGQGLAVLAVRNPMLQKL